MSHARCLSMLPIVALAASGLTQGSKTPGQISGIAFGDIYHVSGHHDPNVQGMNGLWFRRIYLTYDKLLDGPFAVRARLEANSPGDFSGTGTLQTFFKDLYLQYTSEAGHRVFLGLIPTPTWESIESTLGYRAVEKSPLDLFKMGESRDQGISARGPLDPSKRTQYWVMVGNGSGTKGKADKGNTLYLLLSHKLQNGLTVEGYVDQWNKPGHTDWQTTQVNLLYDNGQSRAGLLFANQRRQNTVGSDTNLRVTSFYADTKASDKARPFVRVDLLNRAVPGADKISYLALSKDATPTFFLAGCEFKLSEDVKLIPNFEYVSYRDAKVAPAPKNNLFLRLTFAFSWK